MLFKYLLNNNNNLSTEIKSICLYICNGIYKHLLQSDICLYFQAAYSLSVSGGEMLRSQNLGTTFVSSFAFPTLNIESDDSILSTVTKKIEEEIENNDDGEEIEIDEKDEEYIPKKNDENYSFNIQRRELSQRILTKLSLEKHTPQKNMFFFFFFNNLFFFCRNENESLEIMYEKIENLPLKYSTTELFSYLWDYFYPARDKTLLPKVIDFYTQYWTQPKDTIPYGDLLPISTYSFWSKIKSNVPGEVMQIASDFSIRMTYAGVTEAGVEREFSYIKWLVGKKRYRLSKETLHNLCVLK
jgi:hypothetical protein